MNFDSSVSEKPFCSGFISLVGKPNVGKSTLLNRLIGQKISITANKPQTTRNQIRGILNQKNYQAIFIDTPGIHAPKTELHRRIVNYAIQSIRETDLVCFLIEPFPIEKKKPTLGDQHILETIQQAQKKSLLFINKIDQNSEASILHTIALMSSIFSFEEIVPISALTGQGVNYLPTILFKYLQPGPIYYENSEITDVPERMIASEFIREQVFRRCYKEIPYGVAVMIDLFQEKDDLIRIFASLFVEKESQKGIIIGKHGSMLKQIGQSARQKLEGILNSKIFLSINVKVSKQWSNNHKQLNALGYVNI